MIPCRATDHKWTSDTKVKRSGLDEMRRSAGRKVRETWANPTSSEFPTEEQAARQSWMFYLAGFVQW